MSTKLLKKMVMLLGTLAVCSFPLEAAQHDAAYYLKRGKVQHQHDMDNYALWNLSRALELNPSLYEAANLLAEIYASRNNYQRALEYYEQSLSIEDSQRDTHLAKARIHEILADYRNARDHYLKAQELDGESVEACMRLAAISWKGGKKEESRRYFEKGRTIALQKEKDALRRAELENEKESALRAILTRTPHHPEAVRALYNYYRIHNSHKPALELLKDQIEVEPESTDLHFFIALLYVNHVTWLPRHKCFHLAEKHLTMVLALDASHDEALVELHQIYILTGRDREAAKIFKTK